MATLARGASVGDWRQADARWAQRFPAETTGLHPAAAAALQSGQLQNAISAAANSGNAFASLSDYETALIS